MIEFKLTQHAIREVPVVEIWMNGKFKALICPNADQTGIRFISGHIDGEFKSELCEFRFTKD